MRQPPFVAKLNEHEARLGKIFAEQLHRAMSTEDQAREWADAEIVRRTQAAEDGQPFPSCDDREVFQHLRSCETRVQQARYELNRHCKQIGERLGIPYFARVHDWFRTIAGPVTPIPYDDVNPITVLPKPNPPSNRRNRWCTEHDEHLRQMDEKFVIRRDTLIALNQWPRMVLHAPVPPEPQKASAVPALSGPIRDPQTFTFYEWNNFPPGGVAETALKLLAATAPERHDTIERYRAEDADRQQRIMNDTALEIAKHKAALANARADQKPAIRKAISRALTKQGLAKAYLNRQPAEREPSGRYTASDGDPHFKLEAETRARTNASRIKAFLAKGQRLEQMPTSHTSIARMSDRAYCGSLAHRLQVETGGCRWDNDPAHTEYEPTDTEFFELRFRHHLIANYGIPVYAATVWGTSLEIVHARYFDRLHLTDYDLLAKVGLRIAKQLGIAVSWAGPKAPAQWEIDGQFA